MATESRLLHHGYQGESFNPIGPSFFIIFTCGGITNRVDHVSDEGTAGWTVLCKLIRDSNSKTRGPERGSRWSALIVVVRDFSWPAKG